jgi:ornithine carbamoyltransferase
VIKAAKENADRYGGSFEVVNDVKEAFDGADFVYPKARSPKRFVPPYGKTVDKDGASTY